MPWRERPASGCERFRSIAQPSSAKHTGMRRRDDVPAPVERGSPGSSMRAYVARTLPECSPILVCNRAPREPDPEGGGFKRGGGGVITALLTLAEATEAEWVA